MDDRSGFHCLDGELHIAVTGYDDHRQSQTGAHNLLLQFQPAHAGHADVHDQTSISWRMCAKEILGRGETPHLQTGRLQKKLQGFAHPRIIVDDEDLSFSVHTHPGGKRIASLTLASGSQRNYTRGDVPQVVVAVA